MYINELYVMCTLVHTIVSIVYSREGRYIYVAFLLVKINRKKGQNEEKPLFSNPEAVGLIKVQTLMNNNECAWTNTCGTYFMAFLALTTCFLSSQDPLGTCSPINPQFFSKWVCDISLVKLIGTKFWSRTFF